MASSQYNYPPPPPPPSQSQAGQNGYQAYQQNPYGGPPTDDGRGRGRGGFNGPRGGYQASPYQTHQQYSGSPPVAGAYSPPGPPYMGPSGQNGYAGPQALVHYQQSPPQAQLSPQNYHPNHYPQAYGVTPPQAAPYGPPQPYQQGPYQPQPPMPQGVAPQQWQGGSQHAQAPYQGNGRGRGRGGGGPSGRGGHEAPLMGPPIRMGFDSIPNAQASQGYQQPYSPSQHSPSIPFSAPAYPPQQSHQGYAPPNNFPSRGGRGGFDHRNGRGQMHNRGNKREQYGGDRNRPHRGAKLQHSSRDQRSSHQDRHNGVELPQKPAIVDAKSGDKKKKKKKRKTNTLGLTPGNEDFHDSEEEDDEDEEKKLANATSEDGAVGLPDDLAAWIAERKQKWPTASRRADREAGLAKRRAAAAEEAAKNKAQAKEALDASSAKTAAQIKIEKQQKKAEKLRKQLERAEQKVQEAMKAGMKRKRDEGDVGDEEDDIDQEIANATAGASLSDSDSESGSEYTDATDSDEGPEEASVKQTEPLKVPPPPKNPLLLRQCKYYSTGGTCGKKGKCRFIHDEAVRNAALREMELNGGRMTLAQRLVQNDKEKDDLVVLKSIKYLHEKGFLDEPEPMQVEAEVKSEHTV